MRRDQILSHRRERETVSQPRRLFPRSILRRAPPLVPPSPSPSWTPSRSDASLRTTMAKKNTVSSMFPFPRRYRTHYVCLVASLLRTLVLYRFITRIYSNHGLHAFNDGAPHTLGRPSGVHIHED